MYLGLYVDDIILCGSSLNSILEFKNKISARFKIKDLGEVKQYLGMQINRDRQKGTLTIHMPTYVKEVLDQFNMSDCHPRPFPMDPSVKYNVDMCAKCDKDIDFMRNIPYTSAIGFCF